MLLINAAGTLLVARVAIAFVPFRVIAARLGRFAAPADAARGAPTAVMPDHIRHAEEIGWAMKRAAQYVPFESVCLPQGIAAKWMLRRRGVPSVLHFGAIKGRTPEKPLETHAWLDAAGVEVTGYPVAREFTEIACFV